MLKNIYIRNEAMKNFKGWSKEGLGFLLSTNKDERLECNLKKTLKVYKNEKIQSKPNMVQAIKIDYFFCRNLYMKRNKIDKNRD